MKKVGVPFHPTAHAAEEIAPHLIGEGAVRESVTKSWLRQPKVSHQSRETRGNPAAPGFK